MLSEQNTYNNKPPGIEDLEEMTEAEITIHLEEYLRTYTACFTRPQQTKYFEAFEKGLLSNLDRKSIEPIALTFLGEKEVRGMQQFFTRSKDWEESLKGCYREQLAKHLSAPDGFMSIDESDFVKKGKHSVGVARQYCGRLGKRENCQAGVFLSYASEKGVGIADASLYIPKEWFDDSHDEKRKECQIPSETVFRTKNEIANGQVKEAIASGLFSVRCIGCDAAFGSDHTFLDSLPVPYFASVRKNENIFRSMPSVVTPASVTRGGQFKHPRAEEQPVHIETIIGDESIPWVKRVIAEGAKGPIIAQIKCLRCVSCRKENRLFVPKAEVWVYIRKHEDGVIKFFISNMPEDTSISELDRLATARWSIEQCFQECKSYLGMSHYETRTYQAWHRHMLLVMIAQLFVICLRHYLKKIRGTHHAYDSIYHCRTDSNPI